MLALRSLAFNVAFYAWSALMHLVALPTLALPRRALEVVGRLWARGLLAMLRVLIGLDYEVRGRENLPKGAALVAAKHQSAWDTLIFSQLLDDPSYVLKQELMWVPVFGWLMKHWGAVAVDRQGGAKALRRMLREAKARAAQDRPIVIFPEGTRTPPGETRRYHPGVAALYRELDLPVVPVALTSGLYWPRRSFVKRPGTIVIEALPAIPPGLDRKAFMRRLSDDLESATRRLVEEAKREKGDG